MRTAIIDIGTNTLLLLIVEPNGEGGLRRVIDLCRFGRLGQGLDASGQLHPDAIARSLDICREYRGEIDRHGVAKRRVIATQAMREAGNGRAFTEPAEEILGAAIEIIGGRREAELAYRAQVESLPGLRGVGMFDATPEGWVVADVGGGSTEIIVVGDGGVRVESEVSVPIGAVRLAERHLRHDPPTADERAALAADIDRHLTSLALPRNVPLVCSAGTATNLAAIHLGLATYDSDRVHGHVLRGGELRQLADRLASVSLAERRAIVGVEAQRADVLPAGAAIFARLADLMDAREVIISDRGIRWGLAYECAPVDDVTS